MIAFHSESSKARFLTSQNQVEGNARVTSYSHVEERIVKELSIYIGDVVVFFLQKELFLTGPDVRNNGIKVIVRVPE